MALLNPEIASSRAIRPQIISDKAFWNKAAFLEQLAHQLQRSALIPFRLDKHIENLAFGIYGSLKIGHAIVDLEVEPRPDARWSGAWADVCARPMRSSVRNSSPSSERSRRKP